MQQRHTAFNNVSTAEKTMLHKFYKNNARIFQQKWVLLLIF